MAPPGEIDTTNDGQVQDTLIRALGDGRHCRSLTGAGHPLRELRRIFGLTGADHRLDACPALAAELAWCARPAA